jgi:hypothetical protein
VRAFCGTPAPAHSITCGLSAASPIERCVAEVVQRQCMHRVNRQVFPHAITFNFAVTNACVVAMRYASQRTLHNGMRLTHAVDRCGICATVAVTSTCARVLAACTFV